MTRKLGLMCMCAVFFLILTRHLLFLYSNSDLLHCKILILNVSLTVANSLFLAKFNGFRGPSYVPTASFVMISVCGFKYNLYASLYHWPRALIHSEDSLLLAAEVAPPILKLCYYG